MPLDRYREKRDFDKTSEPAGERREAVADADTAADTARKAVAACDPTGCAFVVQKHAATRLHYDFRLEIGGVLASWAVPKGPSLDPRDKRLAVHVEDHPIEYGSFEGTIPAGEYGGGTVMVWDRGIYEPETDMTAGLAAGELKFTLQGEKLRGSWALVRMKPRPGEKSENWLLIKHRDEHARPHEEYDVTVARPESAASGRTLDQITAEENPPGQPVGAGARSAGDAVAPQTAARTSAAARLSPAAPPHDAPFAPLPVDAPMQLATLAEEAPTGSGWIHEVKYDGYRLRVALEDGSVRLLTRSGADWTDRFGGIARGVQELPVSSALLDGEAVVFGADGAPDFGRLQEALADGRSEGVLYMAFDLLYLEGHDLRGLPLLRRKELLAALLEGSPADSPLRYVEHFDTDGPEFRRQACAIALEGAVSKRGDRPYVPGRTSDWIKAKCLARQEFVVAGWTDPAGSREGFGALVLGTYEDDGELRYAGRVGTGFTVRELREIRERLDRLAFEEAELGPEPVPRLAGAGRLAYHPVRPELVVEVAFVELTWDGVMRQPSFKGVREDLAAADVRREQTRAPDAAAVANPPDGADPPGAVGATVVAGVTLTNPGKVMFEGERGSSAVTKLDLARYYERMAPHILPHIARRPLTVVRCPHGHARNCFYQKHPDKGFPDSLRTVEIDDGGTVRTYFFVEDAGGVIALVQLGALELHAWNSLVPDVELPDRVVFDLDPGPGVGWAQVCDTARSVRDALTALGMTGFVKTTGGKGLHVVTPIEPALEHDIVRSFAKEFVDVLVAHSPDTLTGRMSKELREDRIFIDYLRNAHGATAVAAYSTRARPGATVSVPMRWDELDDDLDPLSLDIHSVPERVAAIGGAAPWEGYEQARFAIDVPVLQALSAARDGG